MKLPEGRHLVFDLESDGLLHELTRIHILVVKDAATGQRWVFRQNKRENTILKGIKLLNEASVLIGHNIVGFDMPALWKLYGDEFQPKADSVVRDTIVMCRMVYADEKERDFRRFHRGLLQGKLIGRHELKAWGQRLGIFKGDYAEKKAAELKEKYPDLPKKEITRLVWAEWSQDMEDYAIQDVEVTDALWKRILSKPWSDFATVLEHEVHGLMDRVSANGFPFDVEMARRLEASLRVEHERLTEKAIQHFGKWWVPCRWLRRDNKKCISYVIGKKIIDPKTGEEILAGEKLKDLPPFRPREEFGETSEREHWGEVHVPKRTIRYKQQVNEETGEPIYRADTTAGAPYCPVEIKEFNPNSRQQIIDRLSHVYGWEPQEFTEEGNPSVNDEVLRDLVDTIPICDELAEIFYFSKRLGQLVDGKNGLIGKAEEYGDNKIHPWINVGGTVTNRASHSNPNIAQVPRVVFKNLDQFVEACVDYAFEKGKIIYGIRRNGEFDRNLTPLLGPDGKQFRGKPVIHGINCKCKPQCLEPKGDYVIGDDGKVVVTKSLLKGRAGDHGWDFRNCFHVPKGWRLMGADQKGIELRGLGHYMAPFDNGAYVTLVVEADPHDLHQSVMELASRDTAKTVIYALVYGAQDYKLGVTIDPTLALKPNAAKALGAEMRRRLMTRIPALGQVVKAVQNMASRGFVEGLDGRQLYVRAKHSALNTLLQGAAATVAKLWCVNFEAFCEDDGLVHGWNGDFAILAWIHDELQVAVRDDPEIMAICERDVKQAAYASGERLGFRAPVDIDVKWGMRWSDTH